jgi:hypothetical protein
VVTYHNGEQYEVKNFRPVKNAFVQQRPGRMEHEISVSDYKRCASALFFIIIFSSSFL